MTLVRVGPAPTRSIWDRSRAPACSLCSVIPDPFCGEMAASTRGPGNRGTPGRRVLPRVRPVARRARTPSCIGRQVPGRSSIRGGSQDLRRSAYGGPPGDVGPGPAPGRRIPALRRTVVVPVDVSTDIPVDVSTDIPVDVSAD